MRVMWIVRKCKNCGHPIIPIVLKQYEYLHYSKKSNGKKRATVECDCCDCINPEYGSD